jgi:gentisate 1,2-dioxygenase
MGVHITFVRSLKMDRWKARELKQMELGGNKLARAYYEKNNMLPSGSPPDHKNPALSKYKEDLKKRALKALGQEVESD